MASSDRPSQVEKRKTQRTPSSIHVRYDVGGHAYEDLLRDIGAGGVFIRTRSVFSVGQSLELTFPLPGYQHFITVTGTVARTTAAGIGIKFDETMQELLDIVPICAD
ncbi:MAG: PilZ domain-containing protein [Deltaproteobacteria bacterium]|nr:PilZ domain-containing protein [Deltaproteobacteria bacterium]